MKLELKDFATYHGEDQKQAILKHLGTVVDFDLATNRVLVATYIEPNVSKGGIFFTDGRTNESKYQSKVGFILKKGAMAFQDDATTKFAGFNPDIGDWVFYRPSSGLEMGYRGVHVRMFADQDIAGTVYRPDLIW